MTMTQDPLAASIYSLLTGSSKSLTACEIADVLRGNGVGMTKTAINAALFVELSLKGHVTQDLEHRWCAIGQPVAKEASADADALLNTPSIKSQAVSVECPADSRSARRLIQTLRSGTSSCGSAKAVSVGTTAIENELHQKIDALMQGKVKDDAIVIAGDWGFGKSHLRMLLSSHLVDRSVPFVHECIDARAASLAHLHRSIPRWLERLRIGRTLGLRDAVQNESLPSERALRWSNQNHSDFANGLRWALGGNDYGWLRAMGHHYRSPDYPYQHSKAWAILESASTFLNRMERGGLVLLLDEAENIDKQYDVRGRRKSYETLARMMRHPHILPVVFVTDRLLSQVAEDFAYGQRHSWVNWSSDAKWFVNRFREIQPIRPPRLTDRLAEQLIAKITALHCLAYHSPGSVPHQKVLARWHQTSTRSIRLLVRLLINELDLLVQSASSPEPVSG